MDQKTGNCPRAESQSRESFSGSLRLSKRKHPLESFTSQKVALIGSDYHILSACDEGSHGEPLICAKVHLPAVGLHK